MKIAWDADMALNKNMLLLLLNSFIFLFRSWEARLSSLYSRSKASDRPAQGSPWYRDFPHVECRRASATATLSQSSVKPGGAVTCFDVPVGATATGLNVSEFSALVTFICPGNTNTVLAYWDLEGQSVTYHRADAPAVPVQRSAEEHLCLLLKRESDLWPHETKYPSIICCVSYALARMVINDFFSWQTCQEHA